MSVVETLGEAARLMRERELFWSKVDRAGDCWVWIASTRSTGYGRFWSGMQRRAVSAHRYAYEITTADPIPAGMVVDHLCRNRLCCNPLHMEVVTNRENVRRGDAAHVVNTGRCAAGHNMTGANAYQRRDGYLNCRTCGRDAQARYAARRRSA